MVNQNYSVIHTMLDFNALKTAKIIETYDTYFLTDLLLPEVRQALYDTYPTEGFTQLGYLPFNQQVLLQTGYIEIGDLETAAESNILAPIWQTFFKFIKNSDYIQQLSQLVNLDLSNTRCIVELVKFPPGGWMDAHYDTQPKKQLTQIFYLNPRWPDQWGGHFNVVTADKNHEKILSVPPFCAHSAIVKASPKAWHEVAAVSKEAKDARVTFQLEFFDC